MHVAKTITQNKWLLIIINIDDYNNNEDDDDGKITIRDDKNSNTIVTV